jgi:gamma-glutamyltranspeptidase/glutathione hydrolase
MQTPLLSLAALLCLAGCASPRPAEPYLPAVQTLPSPTTSIAPAQPEGASGLTAKPGWATKTYAVAAANPLATEAGLHILQAGGSAVDAIAVQMVLALVEPQSSGLGGGAFMLHFDGKTTQAFDGRETAPAGATPTLFLGTDGKPLPFATAVVGGRAVGVPGTVAMLALAHQQHGRLPWAQLFAPAIALANDGFAISPRMATLLAKETALKADPVAAAYFYAPDGNPWPAGHLLRNPELAAVLQRIALEGPDALMRGDVARAIAAKVQQHPSNPGTLSQGDLAAYQPVVRQSLCFDYNVAARPTSLGAATASATGITRATAISATRDYRICGMPPPSSGAIAIGQILGQLQHTPAATLPLSANGVPRADWLHFYTESARLAFADRAQYVADPAFVAAPVGDWASMLAPGYLADRAKAIDPRPGSPRMPTALPGTPGKM